MEPGSAGAIAWGAHVPGVTERHHRALPAGADRPGPDAGAYRAGLEQHPPSGGWPGGFGTALAQSLFPAMPAQTPAWARFTRLAGPLDEARRHSSVPAGLSLPYGPGMQIVAGAGLPHFFSGNAGGGGGGGGGVGGGGGGGGFGGDEAAVLFAALSGPGLWTPNPSRPALIRTMPYLGGALGSPGGFVAGSPAAGLNGGLPLPVPWGHLPAIGHGPGLPLLPSYGLVPASPGAGEWVPEQRSGHILGLPASLWPGGAAAGHGMTVRDSEFFAASAAARYAVGCGGSSTPGLRQSGDGAAAAAAALQSVALAQLLAAASCGAGLVGLGAPDAASTPGIFGGGGGGGGGLEASATSRGWGGEAGEASPTVTVGGRAAATSPVASSNSGALLARGFPVPSIVGGGEGGWGRDGDGSGGGGGESGGGGGGGGGNGVSGGEGGQR